jgi:hypothetical protein
MTFPDGDPSDVVELLEELILFIAGHITSLI